MTRKKVKLAWVENENARAISLKKRRLGLVKKVRELTILCDVKACVIIFSPNEVEPMVWPSPEAARGLLDDFFALPEIEKKKKETSLESYLKEKTKKVDAQLKKSHKKNTELAVDQLMVQLHRGRIIDDLNLSEIYDLLSFSKEKVMGFRRSLDFMEHPPLRDPPINPSEELRTTMNGVFVGCSHDGLRLRRTHEAPRRINMGSVGENHTHYLMDRWFFPPPEPPNHRIHQQMVSYNENPNPRGYLSYQGSSSNGNPNLEMELIGPQMVTFHGLVRSAFQPNQHHLYMSNHPMMAMSQPRQYPYDFLSGVNEERSNIYNGDSQFYMTTGGLRQEPLPNLNGTTIEEGNSDATMFETNRVWPGYNNHHF